MVTDAKFDQLADELRQALPERVPLLQWEVETAEWNRVRNVKFPDLVLASIQIKWSVRVGGERLAAYMMIDVDLLEHAAFDFVDYVVHETAKKMADAILSWKP